MTRRALAAALTAAVVLAGCGDGTTDQEQARQEAGIHQVAQELVTRPGVTCAEGVLSTQGLPSAPRGALRLTLTTEGLPAADQEQLVLDAARQVWESDLAVTALYLELSNDRAIPLRIGGVLGNDEAFAGSEDLETEFGSRPTPPSPLLELDDPGNPDC